MDYLAPSHVLRQRQSLDAGQATMLTTRSEHAEHVFACRFATPMRTPRAEGMFGRDRVLAEAVNLRVLFFACALRGPDCPCWCCLRPSQPRACFLCPKFDAKPRVTKNCRAVSAEHEQHTNAAAGRRGPQCHRERLWRHHAPQCSGGHATCAGNAPRRRARGDAGGRAVNRGRLRNSARLRGRHTAADSRCGAPLKRSTLDAC